MTRQEVAPLSLYYCQGPFWQRRVSEWVTLHYRTAAEGQWAEKKKKAAMSHFWDTHHIADLQKVAVAEWLQSFNSVRGQMERLGII